jgi:hypothetical protein
MIDFEGLEFIAYNMAPRPPQIGSAGVQESGHIYARRTPQVAFAK